LNHYRILEVSSNVFDNLPEDLSFFKVLEELSLADNKFNSNSEKFNSFQFFASLASIPKLKKLNLSRNKLNGIDD
jgi:Leucine-rich repeat (LRR) protein